MCEQRSPPATTNRLRTFVMKDGLPEGTLFPDPYVGPVIAQPVSEEQSVLDMPLSEVIPLSPKSILILLALMIYARFVKGQPVVPFKWIGWRPKRPR